MVHANQPNIQPNRDHHDDELVCTSDQGDIGDPELARRGLTGVPFRVAETAGKLVARGWQAVATLSGTSTAEDSQAATDNSSRPAQTVEVPINRIDDAQPSEQQPGFFHINYHNGKTKTTILVAGAALASLAVGVGIKLVKNKETDDKPEPID